jgi:hypothetical protein
MLEVDGRKITEAGVQTVRVVPTLDELKHRHARLSLRAETMTIEKLTLQGGKKLSHSALSYASPTDPIEGRTPASRQRSPKAIEVY